MAAVAETPATQTWCLLERPEAGTRREQHLAARAALQQEPLGVQAALVVAGAAVLAHLLLMAALAALAVLPAVAAAVAAEPAPDLQAALAARVQSDMWRSTHGKALCNY